MASHSLDALYHVVPLHYTPYLLATGTLFSQAELKRRHLPISPRSSATRRDRKLHLDDFVHLSPRPVTPLLRDKLRRGYPHALISFSVGITDLPESALIRYNPKSWRHREDFSPVWEATQKAEVWRAWQRGKYPSLEVVVEGHLPLAPFAMGIAFPDHWQRDWVARLCAGTGIRLSLPAMAWDTTWPPCAAFVKAPFEEYAVGCLTQGEVLPPPSLPFD